MKLQKGKFTDLLLCRDQRFSLCTVEDDKKDIWKLKRNFCLFQEHRPERLTEKLKAEFLFSLNETLKGLSYTENLKVNALKLEPDFEDFKKYEKPVMGDSVKSPGA